MIPWIPVLSILLGRAVRSGYPLVPFMFCVILLFPILILAAESHSIKILVEWWGRILHPTVVRLTLLFVRSVLRYLSAQLGSVIESYFGTVPFPVCNYRGWLSTIVFRILMVYWHYPLSFELY